MVNGPSGPLNVKSLASLSFAPSGKPSNVPSQVTSRGDDFKLSLSLCCFCCAAAVDPRLRWWARPIGESTEPLASGVFDKGPGHHASRRSEVRGLGPREQDALKRETAVIVETIATETTVPVGRKRSSSALLPSSWPPTSWSRRSGWRSAPHIPFLRRLLCADESRHHRRTSVDNQLIFAAVAGKLLRQIAEYVRQHVWLRVPECCDSL